MNHCPNCNYENPPTSTFCGHCGASFAPTSSPLEPTYKTPIETTIPIPPPPPVSSYQRPAFVLSRSASHKRTMGGTILSLLFYLWAVSCFSFGLVGGILYNITSAAGYGFIFIFCCLAGLVILIPLLLYRKSFYLTWRVRLLLEVGLLLAGFLACLIVAEAHSASHSSTQAYDQTLGIVFVAYGLVAAFVAFW